MFQGKPRAANVEVDASGDRNLRSSSSSTQSLAFSFASATGADDLCFDYRSVCLEKGRLFDAVYVDTNTSGNAFAIAYSEENLWLEAICDSFTNAYAKTCAFTTATGKIQVNNTRVRSQKMVSLSVDLNTATTTFSQATSIAVAQAYTTVEAYSYTSVATFCTQVSNMSPLCAGSTATTDLKQIAVAKAAAVGQADALSTSGSVTGSRAAVQASGTRLKYVNGFLAAYARSWAFAAAGAAAKAFADSFSGVANESFAASCVKKYELICSDSMNSGQGVCAATANAEVACAAAAANGKAYGKALALACAETFISTYANAETSFSLSANVDCENTPFLTWTYANAGIGTYCKLENV